MRLKMFGGGTLRTPPGRKDPPESRRILISRMWRLGDIVMCEPINRHLSSEGVEVHFATKIEYHPLVQAFHGKPPTTIRYPLPDEDRHHYRQVLNLDPVGLAHGHVSKVDAFLECAGIHPSSLSDDEKRPSIELPRRYDIWAKGILSRRGVRGDSLVCITRQSLNERSPRNVPREILDEVCRRLSRDHFVMVLGSIPSTICGTIENLHNLTGSTPDVMSTAGILSNSRALLTVDTGLMHVAGALGVPMVTMMGPTRPEDVSSFYRNNTIVHMARDGCCPCFERGCDDPCLRSASADVIVDVIEERLSNPMADTRIIRV